MNLFWTFVILNIFNVIIQTAKSLATVKCGKVIAALSNAVAYGFYTIVVIYMVCELPLMVKVAVVATCNLIGVYVVKFIEEKCTKERLWKVEATVSASDLPMLEKYLTKVEIPHNFVSIDDNHRIVNFYCKTKEQSSQVKSILKAIDAKFFVSESKYL